KKIGRGCLKGLAEVAKRSKSQSQKMKIEFFENLGGPCGHNRRTFVDEVVLLTKQKAPLIGVRYWRDMSRHVEEDIAECIMVHWDLETTKNPKKKIWKVAMERYKGWRSALHSTYKAYNSYDKRMKIKPEDIDIVEWHYLNKYFATKQFKIAPRSILTTDRSNLAPSENASTTNVAKSMFNENCGRGAGAAAGSKYISSQQLVSGAKTRASKKKAQQHASQAT
ncbi:uncharacterized protein C2845_PM03G29480, partial [Panicum miliaceum]